MRTIYSVILAFILVFCVGILTGNAWTTISRDRAQEDHFLEDCQWAPAATQPDGTVSPRKPLYPFATCYQELIKARTINTVVTLVPAPAAAAPAPVADESKYEQQKARSMTMQQPAPAKAK